jgi:glycerol uptake facilitator-like aquaporin
MTGHKVAAYTLAQIVGGSVGTVLAHVMFDRRALRLLRRHDFRRATLPAKSWLQRV